MMKSENFLDLIRAAFPVEPLPADFFWVEGKIPLDSEIPQELKNRISGRPWVEVTLLDWRMTASSPEVSRRYLEPATFMYYVPSIIVGAFREIEFIYLALEAIIPENKNHIPRGKWWFEFSASASPDQRAAISAFLTHIRLTDWDTIGLANQYLLERAENIWPG